jgi:hypothetical protein
LPAVDVYAREQERQMTSQLPEPVKEQILDRILYADTLLASYLEQQRQLCVSRGRPASVARVLVDATRAALSQDYVGFWEEVGHAVQLLREAGIDVGHVRALGERREAGYTGFRDGGRPRFDRDQAELARRVLQALQDLFPAVDWQPVTSPHGSCW